MSLLSGFLITDEGSLFFDAIAFSEEQVTKCLSNTQSAPWAIIATHTMLQTACVFALNERDTSETACLDDRSGPKGVRQKTIEAMHANPPQTPPRAYLADPTSLLLRTQDASDIMGADAFSISSSMKRDLAMLSEFRNMVVHYLPQTWLLELGGLPRLFRFAFEFSLLPIERAGTYSHRTDALRRSHAAKVCYQMIARLKE